MRHPSKIAWAKANKDKVNAYKRAWRLRQRLARLEGKHCLNCEIFLVARLEDGGRSYLYCRKCLREHRDEVNNSKCRRSYAKQHGII